MSEQYLRAWSLTVANNDGHGLDLSALKIRFAVRQADIQTPNAAYIKIYNLSENTRNRINKGEFTNVILKAGYEGSNNGTIFNGNIKYTARGRDNATDVYVELQCAEGDSAHNYAVIVDPSSTLAAGSLPGDHVAAALAAMAPYGITEGFIAQLGTTALSRGKVLYGMARDVLRIITRTYGVTWSILDGKLQMAAVDGFAPGIATVLTSETGLIGMPVQQLDGIHIRCLMNPNIKPTYTVKIDNASLNRFLGQASVFNDAEGLGKVPETNDDGLYRVYVAEHVGDTRGQEWYTDLICLSVNAQYVPEALIQRVINGGDN